MQQAINKYKRYCPCHAIISNLISTSNQLSHKINWYQFNTNIYRETGHGYIFLRSRANNKYFGLLVIQYLGDFKGNNQRIKYRVFTKELVSSIPQTAINGTIFFSWGDQIVSEGTSAAWAYYTPMNSSRQWIKNSYLCLSPAKELHSQCPCFLLFAVQSESQLAPVAFKGSRASKTTCLAVTSYESQRLSNVSLWIPTTLKFFLSGPWSVLRLATCRI